MSMSQVRADDAGRLVYGDLRMPVAMGASGQPCVFTDSGWMAVDAFEASGLSPMALVEAQDLIKTIPEGPTATAFHRGPA